MLPRQHPRRLLLYPIVGLECSGVQFLRIRLIRLGLLRLPVALKVLMRLRLSQLEASKRLGVAS